MYIRFLSLAKLLKKRHDSASVYLFAPFVSGNNYACMSCITNWFPRNGEIIRKHTKFIYSSSYCLHSSPASRSPLFLFPYFAGALQSLSSPPPPSTLLAGEAFRARGARKNHINYRSNYSRRAANVLRAFARQARLNRINSGTLEADNFPRRYISRR